MFFKSHVLSHLVGFCVILSSFDVLAGGMDSKHESPAWKPLLGLSVGPTWASNHHVQTFNVQPDVQKSYIGNNDNNAFVTAELFLAGQKHLQTEALTKPLLGQIGFVVAWGGDADVSGDVWEDANPNFNNFNYTYKMNHTYLALKGRLLGEFASVIEPYISGSLGVGFNRAYNYIETPKIPEEVPAPNFTAYTKTAFSYTLGVGLQQAILSHFQAALGYEFSDWGQSQLGRATGQTMNQGLSLKHMYAQQIQCSLFYTP